MASGGVKPGIKTTEFWMTLIVAGCSVLVAAGVISPSESGALQEHATELKDVIVQLAASLTAAITTITYIIQRTKAKS